VDNIHPVVYFTWKIKAIDNSSVLSTTVCVSITFFPNSFLLYSNKKDMAISFPRSKLFMSRNIYTDSEQVNVATGAVTTTFRNVNSYHAFIMQITTGAGVDTTYTFSYTTDNTNFLPMRIWDIENEINTTSVIQSASTTRLYTMYCEGMKMNRVVKTGAATAQYETVFHKSPGSHLVWTLH